MKSFRCAACYPFLPSAAANGAVRRTVSGTRWAGRRQRETARVLRKRKELSLTHKTVAPCPNIRLCCRRSLFASSRTTRPHTRFEQQQPAAIPYPLRSAVPPNAIRFGCIKRSWGSGVPVSWLRNAARKGRKFWLV